jgi:hypothetical protein
MNLANEKTEALAYGFYLGRNGNGGRQLEDWLKAEKEVEKGNASHIEKKHLLKPNHKRHCEVPVPESK